MNVTPHLVIETVLAHKSSSIWRSKRGISIILGLLRDATLFEFGSLAPDMEHKDFALDLYERGLFTLPYPVTAFSFTGVPNPSQYISGQRAAGAPRVTR